MDNEEQQMSDPKPAGEEFEDVVENAISDASPLEDEKEHGGTDAASRDGERALGDDAAFDA